MRVQQLPGMSLAVVRHEHTPGEPRIEAPITGEAGEQDLVMTVDVDDSWSGMVS
jgi:hypothetical protein